MGSLQAKLPSPTERMELILLGMSRARPIEALCLEANVSKELFYRWMGRVREAALRELEPRRPGPKESKLMGDAEAEIKKLKARIAELEKDKQDLRKANEYLELVAKTAQRIIQRRGWEDPEPVKKNGKRA